MQAVPQRRSTSFNDFVGHLDDSAQKLIALVAPGMNITLGTAIERSIFAKMLRVLFFFAIAVMVVATPVKVAAQSGFGLRPRLDWMADPCLVTNPPGQVYLVFNPNQYAANDAYRNKTDALALQTALANAKIPPGDTFAPVADTIIADALNTVAEDKRKNVAAQLLSILQSAGLKDSVPASANHAMPSVGGRQPELARPRNDEFSLALFFQRWLLFAAVAVLLVRRLWRYFREVEDDDDFANHLETLALAHRWIFPVYLALLVLVAVAEFFQAGNLFFSLSVLFLASALRGYFCEGDFADHPKAHKVHLALSLALVWLGWAQGFDNYLSDLSTLFHPHVFAWVMLALATRAFSQFYNHPDFAEHRKELYYFMGGFLVFGLLGAVAGYFLWAQTGRSSNQWKYCVVCGIAACLPLGGYFYRWNKHVADQAAGRTLFDMIFSHGAFAEKIRKQKHVPSVLLLRHWREHGEVEKAWASASAHLLKEARALPVWLFALETAVLFRRKPDEAREILRQLCDTEAFHYDHRTVAVAQVQGWMAAAGFNFDPAPFKVERPALEPSAMTNKVEALCLAGRFADAEKILKEVLGNDSLNEAAFTQLIRLYCQDLKKRALAEKLIAEAGDTFGPKLLDFLKDSLDEWMRLPIRSQVKPRNFLGWPRRPEPAEAESKKLSFISPGTGQAPARPPAADPVETYLERLKQTQKKAPDHTGLLDPVDRLLAERRLGSAVELLQQQAESQPDNFDLWLRYAEAHGLHCGNLTTAEKIIRQMERSGNFKKVQIKKAYTRLKKWRDKHPNMKTSW
jgi:hypothetical protein